MEQGCKNDDGEMMELMIMKNKHKKKKQSKE